MSENIIEISSEETEDESNEYSAKSKLGAVHTLSSSDSYSDDEHKSPVNRSSAVSKKQYTIPKLSQYKGTLNSSCHAQSSSEEFPSPSKIDIFQTRSKQKSHRKSDTNIKNNGRSTSKTDTSKQNQDKDKPSSSKSSEKLSNEKLKDKIPRVQEKVNLDDSFSSIKSHTISDSNSSDSSVSLPSPVNKRKKKTKQSNQVLDNKQRERQKKAEDRLKKKQAEAELKAKKKQVQESLRKFKPGECLKHLSTRLDVSITQEPYGNDVLASLDALDTKYEIISQRLPSTITWMRDNEECEEDLLLIIWSGEHFVKLVAEMKIVDEINKFKRTFSNKRAILVVFGFECYMKKLRKEKCTSKSLSNELKNVTKSDIDLAMIQLQLVCKCNCKILETRADIALHISQVAKSVAETPFRLEKQKLEEKSDWHASSDSKDCVKVDKLGNGLGRLWRQQICQFNNVTLDISEAIAQVYKTPTSLVKAYEVSSSRREGEKLLADIIVKRGRGPSASTRTVGKELSKKVYNLFNSIDPDQHLSQLQGL
uniref:Crossover junction endonuclease EME1 n=2 Tax=Cacopsylla melanoneura TaxID=428564 RepID=A0A8D8YXK4_9HEMI